MHLVTNSDARLACDGTPKSPGVAPEVALRFGQESPVAHVTLSHLAESGEPTSQANEKEPLLSIGISNARLGPSCRNGWLLRGTRGSKRTLCVE